jgi:hypothetical protein
MRRPGRAGAAIVALAVVLGGMPLTFGVVVHSSEMMFTPETLQAIGGQS